MKCAKKNERREMELRKAAQASSLSPTLLLILTFFFCGILRHLSNFPEIFSSLGAVIDVLRSLFSLQPGVKAQHPLTHTLSGFITEIRWAFEKTVNHGTVFPISCVSCRAGELSIIIKFVEKLKDDQDVKGFLLDQRVQFIYCKALPRRA